MPEAVTEDVSKAYEKLSVERLCEISWKLFLLYTKDPMVSSYRKIFMREQFSNEEAAKQYDNIYLSGAIHRQGKVFEKLIQGSFFKDENPEVIAMEFYSQFF